MNSKYPKTQGYWVYSHTLKINDNKTIVYFGVSKQQVWKRWKKTAYKKTALEPYLNHWEEMEHEILIDSLNYTEALKIEQELIVSNPNCINRNRSGLIKASDEKKYYQQYREQHREEINEYIREYREQHRDEINEYMKYYREEHKEARKEQMKRYYQEHKEERKEYHKQWYEQNREKRKEQMKQYMREYRAKKRA